MRLRPVEIDFKSAKLTPEEGYVLSRLDGPIEADQIAAVTGLPEAKVDQIVHRLISAGILIVEGNTSPSMIPSVPPGGTSSAPPDGGFGNVMVPSVSALPDFSNEGAPLHGGQGLPPGVTLMEGSETVAGAELPPGVTPWSSSAPPSEPASHGPPASGSPQAATALSETAGSLEPLGLPPTQPPPAFHSGLAATAAESAAASTHPTTSPSRVAEQATASRERAVTAREVPRARAAAASPATLEGTGADGLPEGLLPSLEGTRRLPAVVPDLFEEGDDDPKVEAAPAEGAADSPPAELADSSALDVADPCFAGPAAPVAPSSPPPSESSRVAEGDARRLYGQRLRPLDSAARIELARTAADPDLCALCFDTEPPVIAAVLANPRFGLAHARLIALHHHSGAGIEMLVGRAELMRDNLVQRNLLRNPQLPDAVLLRVAQGKRLQDLYRGCIDRDIPENVRAKLRGELRKRFAKAHPDEKSELVMSTEGRVLHLLAGCTFDGKTTQILCGRTFASSVLVQNLAKFTATPPALLAKIVQQPFVSRQPGLRNLLLRHPNMPGDIKRRL